MSAIELFCDADDFCQAFMPIYESEFLASRVIRRRRERGLCMSEVMTILIAFHMSGYCTFKVKDVAART